VADASHAAQDTSLTDTVRTLEEVVIEHPSNGTHQIVGADRMSISEMGLAPRFLGEIDPLKSLKTLPGFGNGGDGNAGLYVRGSDPGHNLVRLNGMMIFNPNHLMGFFSVFNPNAVQQMTIYRGTSPADHFGRISSYIDLQSDWRPPERTQVNASLGLLHAGIGIKKAVSEIWWIDMQLRKTFMNQTLWPLLKRLAPNDKTLSRTAYDLYDVNVNSALTLKQGTLSFSLYHGGDDFGFVLSREGIKQEMSWKNTAMRIKLAQQRSAAVSAVYQVAYSGYRFGLGLDDGASFISLTNRIGAVQGSAKWGYRRPRWHAAAGVHASRYDIQPLERELVSSEVALNIHSLGKQAANEAQSFIDLTFDFTSRLTARAGISYSYFNALNPAGNAKPGKGYHNFDPAVNATYQLSPVFHMTASWNRSHQALHFLSLTSSSLPADFWMGSDADMTPSTAKQTAIGLYGKWIGLGLEAQLEVFARDMGRLYEYSGQWLNVIDEERTADKLLSGNGKSYGAEWFVKKDQGKLKGYISYTFSRSLRQFPAIEENRTFPFKYDRPHQFHGVAQYTLSDQWHVNAYFTYSNGSNFTPETARFFLGNHIVSEYGTYHSARLPAYHRLDIGASYVFPESRKLTQELSINVINVYNRRNALFQYTDFEGQLGGDRPYVRTQKAQFAILPILPSVTYTIKL